jgi:electron transfer flavoprotein alpha subunit
MSGEVLVFCETRNGAFRSFCGELLTQFRPIAEQEHVALGAVVIGEVPGWESQLSAWGADTVYRLEPIPPEVGPEALADQLTNLVQTIEASFLLFGNSPLARTVAPRVSEQVAGAFVAGWHLVTRARSSAAPYSVASSWRTWPRFERL